MKLENIAQNCHDFVLENEELYELYDKYANSEIYVEIVDFLDIFKPDWRTLKGLGKVAPEYLHSVIENCGPYNEESERYPDFLTRLFLALVDRYPNYESTNAFHRNDIFSDAFIKFYQSKGYEDFEEPVGLTEEDYNTNPEKVDDAWRKLAETENKVFEEFKKWEDDQVYVWF